MTQTEPYQTGGIGWFFWTAKTENNCAPEWDFLYLIDNQIIPFDICKKTDFCQLL